MRVAWGVVASVLLLPTLAVSQEQGWAAKFFGNELTHDFGKAPWGAQLAHKFTITNIYNVPFVVEDARVSCGCTATRKPNGAIPPRGTAELEVTMDTRKIMATGQPKIVNIFVTLRSAPESPSEKIFSSSCTMTVSCLVQSNVRFSHDKISFGAVNVGQSRQSVLNVDHYTSPGWEITKIGAHNYPVDVAVERVQPRGGSRAAFRVIATLKDNAPAGEVKYEVSLMTNDPQTPVITVVMEGLVQAPLVASPNHVNLGNVRLGEVVTGRVILRANGGKPFSITAIEGEGDGVKVKRSGTAATAHFIVIEFVPDKVGKLAKTLSLSTDLPGDLKASFTVEGTGVK